MQKVIVLGDGRRVTLGNYVKAWRAVLKSPQGAMFKGSPSDSRMPADREQCLREFRSGMHDRINKRIPSYGRGRKWSSDWWWDAWRASRDVNTPRLVVRWVPFEFRERLAHRLTSD